jgi:hypothetical protein
MITHLLLAALIRVTTGLSARLRQLRHQPDAGMETADKILWAAVITVVVGAVGAIFRDKLKNFANGLTLTLGW